MDSRRRRRKSPVDPFADNLMVLGWVVCALSGLVVIIAVPQFIRTGLTLSGSAPAVAADDMLLFTLSWPLFFLSTVCGTAGWICKNVRIADVQARHRRNWCVAGLLLLLGVGLFYWLGPWAWVRGPINPLR